MIFKKMKKKFKIASWLKYTFLGLFAVFATIYLTFLFVLPNVIHLEKFAPQIENEIVKHSGFGFEMVNPKLKTSWKMGVKVVADEVSLKYKNGQKFANLVSPSIEVNLPTLVLGHLNLDKIYSKEANVNLVFTKNKQYTIQENIDKILAEVNKAQETESNGENNMPIELRNINIIVDNMKLALKDEILNKTFIVKADNSKISMASLNSPLKLKTQGFIGTEGKNENFVDFKINLQTKLPKAEQDKGKTEPIKEFKPNFDPFSGFDMFALRSNLDADLKILSIDENFKAKGYVNLDKVSIKVNDLRLPESYAKSEFSGEKVNSVSKFYVSNNEFFEANSSVNFGKKTKIQLDAKSDKISLANAKTILKAGLDMLNIQNELSQMQAKGYLTCNFSIKSDLKNVKSEGELKLVEGEIKYPKIGVNLTNIASFLDFANNKITIKDTRAYLNGAKFAVSGTINSNSNLDVKINSDPLKIADIVKLLTQFGAIKQKDIMDYNFTGGNILVSVLLNGKIQNVVPVANIDVNNFSMTVKSLKMPVKIEKIAINAKPEGKDFIAKVGVKNLIAKLTNPQFNISAPSIQLSANSKDLTLSPFNLSTQGTNTKIQGSVKNYSTKPDVNLKISGNLNPSTVLAFVPMQNRKYVSSKGQMPFGGDVTGEPENLKISGNVNSNAANYISIVDIKNIRGQNNTLNLSMALKGDDLHIGGANIVSNGAKIATVTGKVGKIYSSNPTFSPINVVIPQKLQILLSAFGNISLSTDANLSITGNAKKPVIVGYMNMSSISYPQFKTTVQNANIDFKKSTIQASANGVKVAGSDFSGNMAAQSDFSKGIIINSLNFNSNYIDSDALMNLLAAMPNTQTTAGPTLPFTIKSGKGKIGKLKSGTIYPNDISFDYNLKNNVFNITNLNAGFYDGKATGSATYNIANTKVTVDGLVKGVNVAKAAHAFNLSSILVNGQMNAMAKVNFRGTTYNQQMQTLKGQVKFDISNGQYGEAARFERFLQAGNILTQSIMNWNLNKTISAITGKNTGNFKTLNGSVSINNGWANITSFKSQGPNMSLYATGKYNLLTEYADVKVLGKISSTIVSVLGPIGNFTLDSVVEKLPEKGALIIQNLGKALNPTKALFTAVSPTDIAKIPNVTSGNLENTKDFQVTILGPVSKTSSIKAFKWAQNTAR